MFVRDSECGFGAGGQNRDVEQHIPRSIIQISKRVKSFVYESKSVQTRTKTCTVWSDLNALGKPEDQKIPQCVESSITFECLSFHY